MIASELVAQVSALGFRIFVSKDRRLKFKGPKGALPSKLKKSLHLYKQELLDYLRVQAVVEEALRLFPGATLVEVPEPPAKRKAFCGYPDHVETDWEGEPGFWICGICHPNPKHRQNMEDNREIGRSGSPHMVVSISEIPEAGG